MQGWLKRWTYFIGRISVQKLSVKSIVCLSLSWIFYGLLSPCNIRRLLQRVHFSQRDRSIPYDLRSLQVEINELRTNQLISYPQIGSNVARVKSIPTHLSPKSFYEHLDLSRPLLSCPSTSALNKRSSIFDTFCLSPLWAAITAKNTCSPNDIE